MQQQKDKKVVISDINDLSRIFVKTLRELSAEGESLTLGKLSEKLERSRAISDLIEMATRSGESIAKPMLEDEIKKLKKHIIEKNEERSKAANLLKNAGVDLDMEKDFNKRLVLALLRLSRAPGNEPCFPLFDEYRTLMMEDEDLEQRERVLSEIKKTQYKISVAGTAEGKAKQKAPKFSLFSKRGKDDTLNQLKKESMHALKELRVILGIEHSAELERTRNRIDESDDFEYILSLKTDVTKVIKSVTDSLDDEKEKIMQFIQELGERLAEMEKSVTASSAANQKNQKDDLSFHDNLESDIKNMSDTIQKGENLEDLKSDFVSRMEHITSALTNKREEYVIRIENTEKDSEQLVQHFKKVIKNLEDQNKVLGEQSSKDPLTGIFNRRVFNEHMTIEFERYRRYKASFSIIFFDIDHFKDVNDKYGHDAGDRVLKGIAKSTLEILRSADVFARYGGEEFAVILFETDIKQAVAVAEKLHEMINETEFDYEGLVVPITVSIGVTEVCKSDPDPETVVKRADKLMYRAKQAGRNKVVSDKK